MGNGGFANAELSFMGLTTFKGDHPVKSEVTVAKNYMTEKELFALRRMVNAFFDMAELKAEMHKPMYMRDWLETLDKFTADFGLGVRTAGFYTKLTGSNTRPLSSFVLVIAL